MQHLKKWICLIAAAALLLSAVPAGAESAPGARGTPRMTAQRLEEMNGGPEGIHRRGGAVTLLEGRCTEEKITDPEGAARAVGSMIGLIGGDERSRFEYLRTLTDAAGNRYYVFKQMYDNTTVLNGAVKVVTDPDGNMIGLTSSVEGDLPEAEESEGVTAAQAEETVLREMEKRGTVPAAVPGVTEKMILPLVTSVDNEENELDEGRFVWVVYTENPDSGVAGATDLPYLAHYVTMAGEYLYSLPTIRPGDEAGASGFSAGYVFEFMEPAEYTGYVDLSDGTEKEITVTLMRDSRTGMYYLGNIERRILVADCWEFLYNGGNVVLEYSPDNREWDQVGLLSLYNYCRAWDYYAAIGWKGGDGKETPLMILNNYCDENKVPVDNAAYIGYALGWQLFAASRENDYSQCLDVIAHEFTHCVTGTTMTCNSYYNDYGAINEAVSDIQGNLCEMMCGATEDTAWTLGETGKEPVRSMSDPHRFGQPEYVWDLYYDSPVQTPTMINDVGGVHSNSSLLNHIAWRLCENGGMTLEEARAFWFAVDCAMVPGTDYQRMSELLPWVLKTQGLERCAGALEEAVAATRIGTREIPDVPERKACLLTLELPQTETFTDGNWALQILSLNEEALDRLAGRTEQAGLEEAFLKALEDGDAESGGNLSPEEEEKLKALAEELMRDVFYSDMGSAGEDGRTIRMMCPRGRTIPLLLHMTMEGDSATPEALGAAVFVCGAWYDLSGLIELADKAIRQPEEVRFGDVTGALDNGLLTDLLLTWLEHANEVGSPADYLKLIGFEIREGEACELPAKGLEGIRVTEVRMDFGEEAPDGAPARKSRPAPRAEEKTPAETQGDGAAE